MLLCFTEMILQSFCRVFGIMFLCFYLFCLYFIIFIFCGWINMKDGQLYVTVALWTKVPPRLL